MVMARQTVENSASNLGNDLGRAYERAVRKLLTTIYVEAYMTDSEEETDGRLTMIGREMRIY